MIKTKIDFQDIHYSRQKAPFCLGMLLLFGEFFYKQVINFKNYLYEIKFLNEYKIDKTVICVGNLTTGGVGKTPIVTKIANVLAQNNKIAVISRGYGAKISNKNPLIIKDFKEIKFKNGLLCGDEPYQLAKKVKNNVIVITCADRKKSAQLAIEKFDVDIIIMDDGFSNRKLKKDKTILVIDSKMRFGNEHLLPLGPLREPIKEIKRANEIILVDKGDKNISCAIDWVKKYNKPLKICTMKPKKIYNQITKADIILNKINNNKEKLQKAIAFCAIGQPNQFFDFAKMYYDVVETVKFPDHYKYTKNDIKKLVYLAKCNNTNIFLTTQKDETKLNELIKNIKNYSFNVLELEEEIKEI